MTKAVATPRIHQTTWIRNAPFEPYFYYQYDMVGAPWMPSRVAHDLQMPAHLADLLDRESERHGPVEVEDDATSRVLETRVDFIETYGHGDQHHIEVVTNHYLDDGTFFPGDRYRVTDADLHAAHCTWLASMQALIRPVTLPTPERMRHHPHGDGPIKGSR